MSEYMNPAESVAGREEFLESVKFDSEGLVPAIVYDVDEKDVLMLAYMSADSIEATFLSGFATFWSRSRQELWEKGATSGERLSVRRMSTDCDGDSVLLECRPWASTVCHTGSRACFGAGVAVELWD